MNHFDKFSIFLKMCKWVFLILVVLKLLAIISASWWFVFLPIIIPTIIILKDLGAF